MTFWLVWDEWGLSSQKSCYFWQLIVVHVLKNMNVSFLRKKLFNGYVCALNILMSSYKLEQSFKIQMLY